MKRLTESLDAFGLPQEEASMDEAKRINYKGLLNDLLAAVDTHLAVMAGTAEEGTEDTLEAVLAATKEALEPKEETPPDEGGEPTPEPEPEMEEAVSKKKDVKVGQTYSSALHGHVKVVSIKPMTIGGKSHDMVDAVTDDGMIIKSPKNQFFKDLEIKESVSEETNELTLSDLITHFSEEFRSTAKALETAQMDSVKDLKEFLQSEINSYQTVIDDLHVDESNPTGV
jgi:hypothetical protein